VELEGHTLRFITESSALLSLAASLVDVVTLMLPLGYRPAIVVFEGELSDAVEAYRDLTGHDELVEQLRDIAAAYLAEQQARPQHPPRPPRRR
jgi:hypothetical protein